MVRPPTLIYVVLNPPLVSAYQLQSKPLRIPAVIIPHGDLQIPPRTLQLGSDLDPAPRANAPPISSVIHFLLQFVLGFARNSRHHWLGNILHFHSNPNCQILGLVRIKFGVRFSKPEAASFIDAALSSAARALPQAEDALSFFYILQVTGSHMPDSLIRIVLLR